MSFSQKVTSKYVINAAGSTKIYFDDFDDDDDEIRFGTITVTIASETYDDNRIIYTDGGNFSDHLESKKLPKPIPKNIGGMEITFGYQDDGSNWICPYAGFKTEEINITPDQRKQIVIILKKMSNELIVTAKNWWESQFNWTHTYREEDLEAAKGWLSEDVKHIKSPVELKFLGYEEMFPWKIMLKNRTGEMKPMASKATFGWGKGLLYKKFEKLFFKKYDRNPLYGELSPAIIINGVIGDGMGRTVTAHALGQKVRVAKFQTEEK